MTITTERRSFIQAAGLVAAAASTATLAASSAFAQDNPSSGAKPMPYQAKPMSFDPKSIKGISEKMLWRNEETGASIAMIRFDKGAGIPAPHYHASNQFMICLKGRYEYTRTGVTLSAGSFYCNPKGNVHGPAVAHEETIVIEVYDGPHYPFKPEFYADEQDAR